MVLGKKVIGVFSRESQESYQWFINFLLTLSGVSDVRPVYISNNDQDFWIAIRKCHFCVLYHSKNRGRVNVTDVTDSLYDKELEALCTTHGKSNVIVVIDDLVDSSDPVRSQILKHQPSIGTLARDLFLFSAEEKRQYNEESLSQNGGPANGKLRKIKDIINGPFSMEPRSTSRPFSMEPLSTSLDSTLRLRSPGRPAPNRRTTADEESGGNRSRWVIIFVVACVILIIVIVAIVITTRHK